VDISHTSCWTATKFDSIRGLANQNLFPKFGELWFGGTAIPCGDWQHASVLHSSVIQIVTKS